MKLEHIAEIFLQSELGYLPTKDLSDNALKFFNEKEQIHLEMLMFRGNCFRKIYTQYDRRHRCSTIGPAYQMYSLVHRSLVHEEYIEKGLLHRDPLSGPARISYFNDGKLRSYCFYVRGNRVKGPDGYSEAEYLEDGTLKFHI